MPEEIKKVCICEMQNGKYICLATGTADCAVAQALQLAHQAHKDIQQQDVLQKFNCTQCSLYYDYIKQNQK